MSRGASRPVGAAAVKEALATVRARAILIVVVALLGVAAGVVYGASKQDSEALYTMRLRLLPLSENTAALGLGVSAPAGPIAADFVSDRVMRDLSDAVGGTSPDVLREELQVSGIEGDPDQMKLSVPTGISNTTPPKLLRAWLVAIQADRHAYVAAAIRATQDGYLEELAKRHRTQSRREIVKNLARLAGLQGSLRTDVALLRAPQPVPATASRSPVFYAIAGGAAGLLAGIVLALAIGLLDRRIRTQGAMSAQFGLPILADLRTADGAAALARRLQAVDRSGASISPLAVVEAGPPGGATRVASALRDVLDVKLEPVEGIWDEEAQTVLRGDGSWLIAVTPGETRANQAADVAAELAVLPSAPLGLVLV